MRHIPMHSCCRPACKISPAENSRLIHPASTWGAPHMNPVNLCKCCWRLYTPKRRLHMHHCRSLCCADGAAACNPTTVASWAIGIHSRCGHCATSENLPAQERHAVHARRLHIRKHLRGMEASTLHTAQCRETPSVGVSTYLSFDTAVPHCKTMVRCPGWVHALKHPSHIHATQGPAYSRVGRPQRPLPLHLAPLQPML
jgi:hypothetical protein